MAILSVLATTAARAQDRVVVSLAIEDCESAPIDRAALAERVALELSLPATEVTAADVAARTRVRIHAPCDSTRVTLSAHVDGREVARNEADLADTTGLGRVWALALLAAELVRSNQTPWRPEPVRTPPREEPPEVPTPTILGAGLTGQLRLEVVTVAPGLIVTLTHGWLRVALTGFAMDVSAPLGAITFLGAEAALGARAVLAGDTSRFGAGASVHGGFVHAIGRSSDPDRRGASVTRALGGASVSLWADWQFSPALLLDLEVTVGYDVVGPILSAGPDRVASLHGPRAGLTLTLATPL